MNHRQERRRLLKLFPEARHLTRDKVAWGFVVPNLPVTLLDKMTLEFFPLGIWVCKSEVRLNVVHISKYTKWYNGVLKGTQNECIVLNDANDIQ